MSFMAATPIDHLATGLDRLMRASVVAGRLGSEAPYPCRVATPSGTPFVAIHNVALATSSSSLPEIKTTMEHMTWLLAQ
jgi:hypothetical protein